MGKVYDIRVDVNRLRAGAWRIAEFNHALSIHVFIYFLCNRSNANRRYGCEYHHMLPVIQNCSSPISKISDNPTRFLATYSNADVKSGDHPVS